MIRRHRLIALCLAAASVPAAAGEGTDAVAIDDPVQPATDLEREILVVARGFESAVAAATPAVSVFDRADIRRRRATQVADLLREAPGVIVVRDGPLGQFTRLHVRGAASNQTLVLVDGVPQNDATSGGGFDLNDLLTDGVERVEVLRGSYGVLYGSEAVGGVVSVTTRRGRGPLGGVVRLEGGSFDTHRETLYLGGADGATDYALSLGNVRTHGERSGESFRAHDAVARLGFAPSDDLRIDLTLRHVDSQVESPFDFGFAGFPLPEDGNIERTRHTLSTGATLTWDAVPWLVLRARGSLLRIDSDFDNGPDGRTTIDPDFTPGTGDEFGVVQAELAARSEQRDLRLRAEGTVLLGELLGWDGDGPDVELTVGGEHLNQRGAATNVFPDFNAPTFTTSTIRDTDRTRSWFAQAETYVPDGLGMLDGVLTLGWRRDRHSEFGSETSPFVGARVTVAATDTTLRATYGEGFRAPKPAELLDAFVGNTALGPETSQSFDAGLSQPLLDGDVVVGVTWFRLRTRDLIAFDTTATSAARPFGQLVNLSRTETAGWETSLDWDLGEGFRARGSYTRQDPRDSITGLNLPNRAQGFGSAGISWRSGPFEVSLDGSFSGRNHDQGGEFPYPEPRERESPGRRHLVSLAASWQATEALTLYARVENLLDDDWVATPSAPAGAPLAAYVGARFEF